MKKLCPIILIIFLVFILCSCNGVSNSDEFVLTEDMSLEDLFDLLYKANSFSVEVGEFDYRFIKEKGYSILEETEENGMVYEAFFMEDNKLYTINRNDNDGLSVTYREIKEEDYQKILDTYNQYVEYVKGTYASTQSGARVSMEIKEDEAMVKTIYSQGVGMGSIKECRIYAINSSTVNIPRAYAGYKELAKYEELS